MAKAKCKYCGAEIEWRRLESGKWVPLDPHMPDVRHKCNPYYEKKIMVTCTSCGRIPEDEVEFRNIEEDMQGKDVLTFKCPKCGEVRSSHRLG